MYLEEVDIPSKLRKYLGELKNEMSLNKYQEGKVKGIGGDVKTDILEVVFLFICNYYSFCVQKL